MKLTSVIHDILDLVYPRLCLGCGNQTSEQPEGLCLNCLTSLPRTNFHFSIENAITSIFIGRLKIQRATAYLYFEKGGITQHLLHLLKYQRKPEVGKLLGNIAGADLHKCGFLSGIDCIIPVPLHPEKLKTRGYNQSEMIASGISEKSGVPLLKDAVVRSKHTSTQTRKSRYERWTNVDDIFKLRNQSLLRYKHILLVDDVITTGSTLESCASSLARVEGLSISLFCMAFAP